jgi:hypothetical protein
MAYSLAQYREFLNKAQRAPDGGYYVEDPARPGKYLMWQPAAADADIKLAAADNNNTATDASSAAPESDDAALMRRWGLEAPAAPTGVIKAPKVESDAALMRRWGLGAPSADTSAETAPDVAGPMGAASAATGGYVRGTPIVGPVIDNAAQAAAARIRSVIYGTPYEAERKAVGEYARAAAAEHPKTEFAGNVAGGIAAVAPAMAVAPGLMGLSGSLLTRSLAGAGSGAAINAADAAVRSGGDPTQTALGGLIGGTFGGAAPGVGQAVGAGVNKLMNTAVDPLTRYLASRAAELGIPLRPPQLSNSPFVQKLDQMLGQLPGSGQAKRTGAQQLGVDRAIASTFGEDADTITPSVMQAAKKRIGAEFNDIIPQMKVRANDKLANRLAAVADETKFLTDQEKKVVDAHLGNVADKFETFEMPGKAYHALVKKGAPLDKAIKSDNSNIASAAVEIRSALDEAAQASSSPELAARLANAKLQYKNMKTVEPLVTRGVPGEISALQLQPRVSASYRNRAYTGAGDLGDIADVAQRFMRQPRDSGTPIGTTIMNLLTRHGMGAVPGTVLGGAEYLSSGDPLKAAGMGAVGLAGTAATARTLSSLLNNPAVIQSVVRRAPAVAPAIQNLILQRTPEGLPYYAPSER